MAMDDVVAASALAGADEALDTDARLWILGLAHITELNARNPPLVDEIEQVLDLCRSSMDFPAGPVRYHAQGWELIEAETFRALVLTPPEAPHLQLRIALGRDGVVGVAMTRSGRADGVDDPSAALLTDLEAVLADLYSVTLTVALTVGRRCPIDMRLLIPENGPGATPTYYAPDDQTGELVPLRRNKKPFKPIDHRYEITAETTPEQVDEDLVALATAMAKQIGARAPYLVTHRRPLATIRG